VGGAGAYGWFYFIKTPAGRLFWIRAALSCRFSARLPQDLPGSFHPTLASLIRSGVPILEVLQIVSQTVGNVVMKSRLRLPPSILSAARAFPRRSPSIRFPEHDASA